MTHIGTHTESNPPITLPLRLQSLQRSWKILSKYVRYVPPVVSPDGVVVGYARACTDIVAYEKKRRERATVKRRDMGRKVREVYWNIDDIPGGGSVARD